MLNKIDEVVKKLKNLNILAIILYGSYKKDYFRKDSDIDICVVAPKVDKEKLFQEILNLMQDEKIDIKIFELMPLYLKMKVIKEGKILWAEDKKKLNYYFWQFIKLWEDEEIAIKKLK